jgi:hypothetical protein
MTKRITTLLIFLFMSLSVLAQVLEKSIPFQAVASFMEPDGRTVSLRISATDFVLLTKAKGFPQSDATYLLERFDIHLNQKYSIPLTNSFQEEYKELYLDGNHLILLSEFHLVELKKTRLVAYIFDVNTGAKIETKTIHETVVKEWLASISKGTVKQSFEQAICSGQVIGYVTPLQYQYHVVFSPDSNKLLVYFYDYGQKALITQALLLDKHLNVLQQGIIPIDNGFINYGIYPNNRGDVYILNGDKGGKVALIQYSMETRENKFLDVQGSSTRRESIKLLITEDDMVYVANVNTRSGILAGIMYSRFNFKDNLIDKINYYNISDGIVQTVNASRSGIKMLGSDENWLHFELTDFMVNEFGKVIMVIEKREIQDPMVEFDPMSVQDIKLWTPRMTKVNVETTLLFSFNVDDELLWENAYVKSQSNDLAAGIEMASYCLNITKDGKVRMLYSGYENQTTGYNHVTLVEWDENSGIRIKDIKLDNPEQIGMLRAFTIWIDDRVVIAGKKGMLGKKAMMQVYKLAM